MCARSWNWFSLPRQRPGGEGSSEGCPLRLMHPDSLFTGTLKSLPCLQRAPGQADDGNTGQGRIPLSLHGERRRRDPQNKADPVMEGLLHPHWREGEFPPTQRGLAAWGGQCRRSHVADTPVCGVYCRSGVGGVVGEHPHPIPISISISSHSIPSYPALSYHILSHPIPAIPIPPHSHLTSPHSIPSHPSHSHPIHSSPLHSLSSKRPLIFPGGSQQSQRTSPSSPCSLQSLDLTQAPHGPKYPKESS